MIAPRALYLVLALTFGSDFPVPFEAVSEPAPDLTFSDASGEEISLSDFRGRVLFLNFFGTWCVPCHREFPQFEELYAKYQDDPDVAFLIVGMDGDKTPQQIEEHLRELGYTFPVAHTPTWEVPVKVGSLGVPSNYLIDASGVIRYHRSGLAVDAATNEPLDYVVGVSGYVEELLREVR